MERVTIHRALAELKLIGSRIDKGLEELKPVGLSQKNKLVDGVYNEEKFKTDSVAKFQSIQDLIQRRIAIKSAIVISNADTMVLIGGKTMSVSDAITMKALIGSKKLLAQLLRKKFQVVKSNMEKNNAVVDANAMHLAEAALGKEGVKLQDNDVEKVTGLFLEQNKFSIVDAIGVEDAADKIEKEVADFESEVDAVLSESNAITTIEL